MSFLRWHVMFNQTTTTILPAQRLGHVLCLLLSARVSAHHRVVVPSLCAVRVKESGRQKGITSIWCRSQAYYIAEHLAGQVWTFCPMQRSNERDPYRNYPN